MATRLNAHAPITRERERLLTQEEAVAKPLIDRRALSGEDRRHGSREACNSFLGGALSGGVSGGCSSRFHTLPSPTASVLVVWSSTSEGLVALRIPALAGTVGMSGYSSYEGSVWVWRGR